MKYKLSSKTSFSMWFASLDLGKGRDAGPCA